MIYDLLKVLSCPTFENSRIDHFTDLLIFFYLIDTSITHIEKKYVIKLAKNLNFCANRLVVKHRKGRSKLLA